MDVNDVAVLSRRIAGLERAQRRTKVFAVAGIAAALLVGHGVSPAHADTPAKSLKAESFELVDSRGKVRGRWWVNGDVVTLEMDNENGKQLVLMQANENFGGIDCGNSEHPYLVQMAAYPAKDARPSGYWVNDPTSSKKAVGFGVKGSGEVSLTGLK